MTIKNSGRLAGVIYLLSAIIGGFGYSYIRQKVFVPNDAAASAANLLASESLFRAAIVATLVSQVLLFFLGLILFRLFRDVHRGLAMVLLASVFMTVAVAVMNQLNNFGALLVLSQADYLKVFNPEQLKSMAMVFLRLGGIGQGLLEIFLTPLYVSFGLLVIKSKYLPKLIGILLIVMGAGFAVNLLDKFLVPQFHPALFTRLAMWGGALGGVPTVLWLLIKGVRVPEARA